MWKCRLQHWKDTICLSFNVLVCTCVWWVKLLRYSKMNTITCQKECDVYKFNSVQNAAKIANNEQTELDWWLLQWLTPRRRYDICDDMGTLLVFTGALWGETARHQPSADSFHKGLVRHSIDVFFVVILAKLLNKQWNCWWFGMPWRLCGATVMHWPYILKRVLNQRLWQHLSKNILTFNALSSRVFNANNVLVKRRK